MTSPHNDPGIFLPHMPPKPRQLRSDALRLVGLGVGLVLLLALVSHLKSDPSLTTFSSSGTIHNWMGRLGAIVSDLLFQLAGIGAFILPLVVVKIVWTIGKPAEASGIKSQVLAIAFLILSLSGLAEIGLGTRLPRLSVPHAGGLLGIGWKSVLVFILGPVGASLVSVVAFIVSLIVVFNWTGIDQIVRRVRAGATFAARLSWRGATTAFRRSWIYFSRCRHSAMARFEPGSAGPVEMEASEYAESKEPGTEPSLTGEPSIETPTEAITIGLSRAPRTGRAGPKFVSRKGSKDFKLPPLSLLSGKAESRTKSVDKNWYLEKGNILVQKLKDFGVDGEVSHISPGPVITVYEFKPASGVKIKEIANLSDDLTLALSVLSVRIVAPIPGKPVVGIEIPSPHREMVFFKDLVNETPFFKDELKIPIALGRLASGEPIAADLASMPHLLIAGTTGTGKSVFINTLISSLLFRFTPKELKLILVDPKMVELALYEDIPHLLLPVVVDSKKAALALRWTVDEMERRYTLLHQLGVRHIDAYNGRMHEFQKSGAGSGLVYMPYIVVVIDEYADLMAVVPKDVEMSIARLAQKARASGIHLVLATQRPSTDVVTGTIKANFPSRMSFRVASSVDSKTILDRAGAERLLGNGDLLFHSAGFTTLKRMQGPYISDSDIEQVVSYLKSQGAPEYDEKILRAQEEFDDTGDDFSSAEEGELYDRALRLVTEKGEASISLIQRHLRIGYNRAATLMEELEKNGVVSQSSGNAKRRAVIPQAI